MEYKNVLITVEAEIATVTINRPKALNALNIETKKELKHFFTEGIDELKPLKGVVLTGAGEKAFVAGADIKHFLSLDAEKATELSKLGHEAFNAIENQTIPVIAAINGFALGGGCELAMACHLRVASTNAKFGQPEVTLGITPGYGGTQRLPQLVGKGRAMELLLTGDMIDAQKALEIGLVNKIVEAENLIATAKKYIEKIGTKGPLAVSKTIQCVLAAYDEGTNGMRKEINSFGQLAGTEDFKEGATAFIEKRKASFKGK